MAYFEYERNYIIEYIVIEHIVFINLLYTVNRKLLLVVVLISYLIVYSFVVSNSNVFVVCTT